jgi:endonuclease-3
VPENVASGRPAAFETGTAGTRAGAVVDRLGERYRRATYGDADGFECLVRTILSQTTGDTASQPAHDAPVGRYEGDDLAAALADADLADLQETGGGVRFSPAAVPVPVCPPSFGP